MLVVLKPVFTDTENNKFFILVPSPGSKWYF